MRYTQNDIRITVKNINYYTDHKVKAYFTQGCGTSLNIDGIDYHHIRRDGTTEGFTPRKCMEILKPYSDEAVKKALEKSNIS